MPRRPCTSPAPWTKGAARGQRRRVGSTLRGTSCRYTCGGWVKMEAAARGGEGAGNQFDAPRDRGAGLWVGGWVGGGELHVGVGAASRNAGAQEWMGSTELSGPELLESLMHTVTHQHHHPAQRKAWLLAALAVAHSGSTACPSRHHPCSRTGQELAGGSSGGGPLHHAAEGDRRRRRPSRGGFVRHGALCCCCYCCCFCAAAAPTVAWITAVRG